MVMGSWTYTGALNGQTVVLPIYFVSSPIQGAHHDVGPQKGSSVSAFEILHLHTFHPAPYWFSSICIWGFKNWRTIS